MDVLQSYTTYKRFFGLIKQVEDDPDVPRRRAAKALTRYLELHPVNIEQVVSVIVEHFRLYVMHELGGRAKAMVVTGSRLAAVKYKLAVDRYIDDQGYTGIRSLVAFSGTVEDPDDPGSSYTEVSMNDGLAESELPETFERDDYRVLLVAEKYQTGFDQPLLQTMYVVKRLAGVQAVQTLSRLNRIAPGKSRTFILDFANEEDDIYKAFKPYYETTPVGENADPHRLSELQHRLLEWAIFTPADVTAFAKVSMNDGLAESEPPETFERDDYRVLLVAVKYQNGFDQPLLQIMYVVKRLAGVQAVQTLSRLNRIAPGKSRTFILDFANEEDDIYKAFKPYYETTPVGENADPHRLSELQHRLLEWAIFTPADVTAFAKVWYRAKRHHSVSDHRVMNAVLDTVVQRFQDREEEVREEFRGQLKAYRNLYAFLSQIIPYQDSDLERLYAFVRNLLSKLPPPGDGQAFVLDDEVALRFFRLQQMTEGSIDLSDGEADPLKGPTDVGTAQVKDEDVTLSSLIDRLNERFGTNFTDADQLFFDQIRASAENNENIAEVARANSFKDFASYLDRMLDELFIARMEGNEEIFSKVMTDTAFRSAAHEHLASEIFLRVREKKDAE